VSHTTGDAKKKWRGRGLNKRHHLCESAGKETGVRSIADLGQNNGLTEFERGSDREERERVGGREEAKIKRAYRSFLSFNSTSVAAPTRMRATPPAKEAIRSSAFSLSNAESMSVIESRMEAMRALMSSLCLPVKRMVAVSCLGRGREGWRKGGTAVRTRSC
jgi:hypothetical protein